MIIRPTTIGGMPCVRLRLPTATGLHPAHSDLLQASPACGSAQRPVLPGSGEGVCASVVVPFFDRASVAHGNNHEPKDGRDVVKAGQGFGYE
jgi:hypothetical protein